MTKDEQIQELKKQLDVCRRERDDYRDMLKGISINIDKMLKPVGN
jgi:hypothetical protein